MLHARTLALSVAALAMTLAACATVPEGAVEDAALECPSGSDCYDVPRALGDGGQMRAVATEFDFPEIEGTYWAGDIEVTLDNVGDAEHNIVFEGSNEGSSVPQAPPGESDTASVNLFEGEYVYYCSIPGHRAQGMEGTLTIYPTQDEAAEELTDAPTDVSTDRPEDDAEASPTAGQTDAGEATDVPTADEDGTGSP